MNINDELKFLYYFETYFNKLKRCYRKTGYHLTAEERDSTARFGLFYAFITIDSVKGNFLDYAEECVKKAIKLEERNIQKWWRIESKLTLHTIECYHTSKNVNIIDSIHFDMFLERLDSKEKYVADFYINGYSKFEVCKMTLMTENELSILEEGIRRKWIKYLDNSGGPELIQ